MRCNYVFVNMALHSLLCSLYGVHAVEIGANHTEMPEVLANSSNSEEKILNERNPINTTTTTFKTQGRRNSSSSPKGKSQHELNDLTYSPIYYITTLLTILLYSFILMTIAKKKRSPTSVFIASLAFADIFVSIIVVPLKISEIHGAAWQKNIDTCRLVNCLTLLSIAMASINILIINMNRILFFLQPMRYKVLVTCNKAIVACVVGYLLTLPTLLPVVGVFEKTTDDFAFCAFKFTLSIEYMWLVGVTYFLVPVFVIIVTQILILSLTANYFHFRRSTSQFLTNSSDESSNATTAFGQAQTTTFSQRAIGTQSPSVRKGLRIQKMFLFITIMFFICWGPFVAGIVCNLLAPQLITPVFIQVMRILVFTNSFINPLIILLTNPQYLRAFSSNSSNTNRVVPETGGNDATIRSSFYGEHPKIFLVSQFPRKP